MKISFPLHMNILRYIGLFAFILSAFFAQSQTEYKKLFGDSIKEISWSFYVMYLPSIQSESIYLKATPNSLRIKHSETSRRNKARKKNQKIRLSKNNFVTLYQRYLELSQPIVNIGLSENEKDLLRKHIRDTIYDGRKIYSLTTEQLETYLASDSISMDMSVFKIDSLPNYGSVIDGAPFWIDMRTLYHNNDSTQFSYSGNLGGSDEYKDSNKHLLINTLNRETNLFKQIPFDYYFTPDRYLRIILRYMEGNEGLLEFIPYHLILEELFPKDE